MTLILLLAACALAALAGFGGAALVEGWLARLERDIDEGPLGL